MAVINVHDVYTLVTHEVSLMAIALWTDTTVTSGRGSWEGGNLVSHSRAAHTADMTQ